METFPQPETDRQLVLFLGQPCPLESVIGLCFSVNDNRTADLVSLVVSWRFCYGPRQEREMPEDLLVSRSAKRAKLEAEPPSPPL